MNKLPLLLLSMLLLTTAGCSKPKPVQDSVTLNNIHNGVILYYTGDSEELKQIKETLTGITNEHNLSLVVVDVNSDSGRKQIADYASAHKVVIDSYDQVNKLEKMLLAATPADPNSSVKEYRKSIVTAYQKALEIAKEPNPSDEQKKEQVNKIHDLFIATGINEQVIKNVIDERKSTNTDVPYYSEFNGDSNATNLPMIKVIVEDKVSKAAKLLIDDSLKGAIKNNKFKDFMIEFTNVNNFGKAQKQADNADTPVFIQDLYVW